MPLLSDYNCFSILPTYEVNEIAETPEVMHKPQSDPPWTCRPKWERWLPPQLIIATSKDNPKSLWLKVEVETTDTAEVKSMNSLVHSGATSKFIDWQYVKSCRLWTQKLSRLIPVHNIDGTLNEASSITEVVDLILWYKGHSERTLFAITSLEKEKLILGHSWLQAQPRGQLGHQRGQNVRVPTTLLHRVQRGSQAGME